MVVGKIGSAPCGRVEPDDRLYGYSSFEIERNFASAIDQAAGKWHGGFLEPNSTQEVSEVAGNRGLMSQFGNASTVFRVWSANA